MPGLAGLASCILVIANYLRSQLFGSMISQGSVVPPRRVPISLLCSRSAVSKQGTAEPFNNIQVDQSTAIEFGMKQQARFIEVIRVAPIGETAGANTLRNT